jgi:hypothetical protein
MANHSNLMSSVFFLFALSFNAIVLAESGRETPSQAAPVSLRAQLDSTMLKIKEAGQRGVGIKSYQDAFDGIEADYNGGAKPEILQKRLDSLLRALDEQSARAKQLKGQQLRQTAYAKLDVEDENDNYNYGPFMEELQRRIRRAWHPPVQTEGYHLKTLFVVDKNGDFSDFRIEKPHDLDAVNASARKAVEEAGPMRIPNPRRQKPINIEFTFDYNNNNKNR